MSDKNLFEGYELIEINEVPRHEKWVLVPLYKIDQKGKQRYWQIGFDGEKMLIMYGCVDGEMIISDREVSMNSRNISFEEKALEEAKKKFNDKLREDYEREFSDECKYISPMLSNEYEPDSIVKWPVAVQPKLNGARMLVSESDDGIFIRSRKDMRYKHIRHFDDELTVFFRYLPPNVVLDGELYKHGELPSVISGCFRSTVNECDKLKEMEYWIFDIVVNGGMLPFEERNKILTDAYVKMVKEHRQNSGNIKYLPSTICIVKTYIAENHKNVENLLYQFINKGYEGAMIKKLANGCEKGTKVYNSSIYKSGRNSNTLKYKIWNDEEGEILDIEKGKGTQKDAAILIVKDPRGNIFKLSSYEGATIEKKREIAKNKNEYIGKYVKYKYRELTKTKTPLHAVIMEIGNADDFNF